MKTLNVKVKCGRPETKIVKTIDGLVYLDVHAKPISGKANLEILKFFKKEYKCKVEIIKGLKSNLKVIKVE